MPRHRRHFGWRLLHGAVRCGAAAVRWSVAASVEELRGAVCCREQSCSAAAALPSGEPVPAMADISHVFLHCPAVRPAVEWLRALWHRIAPLDAPVPVDARVVLLGDESVWQPVGGRGPAGLWLHLRLLFCRAVWAQAGCRSAGPVGADGWRAVVATTSAWLSRAIRQDWLRVTATLTGAAVLPSWCVLDKRF